MRQQQPHGRNGTLLDLLRANSDKNRFGSIARKTKSNGKAKQSNGKAKQRQSRAADTMLECVVVTTAGGWSTRFPKIYVQRL